MTEFFFIIYYLCVALAVAIGVIGYKNFDPAMQRIVVLLIVIAICELIAYVLFRTEKYKIRYGLYHFATIARMVAITSYFLKLIRLNHSKKLWLASFILWTITGAINIVWFQPVNVLNTNMMMLESFNMITLSLCSIYLILKHDTVHKLFYYAHFWVAILWLILGSATFFFWAFLIVLYHKHWEFMGSVLNMQAIINIMVYGGIAAILFLYPKMKRLEHR